MGTPTQPAAGYYVWEVPGKPVAVHLRVDVADRLLAEVMRGFAAIPKRGAEVGGVLIGRVELGDLSIVRVDDFKAVECDYKRGPSYLFSDGLAAFKAACDAWAPGDSRPAYAVGYFRSHTRDGFALVPEDIELLDQLFPAAWNVVLLVRPYGSTKASAAGFFFREGGEFQKSTPLEFSFRPLEATGGNAPPRRPSHGGFSSAESSSELAGNGEPAFPQRPHTNSIAARSRSRVRGWVWIPLSFIFLLLGVLLGFQTALSLMPKMPGGARDFSLGLSAVKSGDNLSVRWDPESPVVHGAQRGTLEIVDGQTTKSVDLDPAQLQNGIVIYHNSSDDVKFRLIVYPKARVSVTETMEWKR